MADAPTNSQYGWLAEVLKNEEDLRKPEEVYRFSNGRTFESTDKTDSGIYA